MNHQDASRISPPHRPDRSRPIAFALVCLAALAALVLTAAPAQAAVYARYHATDDISARLTPTAAPTNLVGPHRGQTIDVQCQVIGEPVGPRGNTLYFQTTWNVPGRGPTTIYVPDTWTDSPHLAGQPPIAGIPMCGSSGSSSGGGTAAACTARSCLSRTWQLRFCVSAAAGCNPATSAANLAPSISAGSAVTMVCWQDGVPATGDYTTNRWFWVRAGVDLQGFVSASVVRNQVPVPSCTASRNVMVAQAAAALSGQTSASAADAALFSRSAWSPGPYGEWAGDCPKVPWTAWYRATGRTDILQRNAIQNYRDYNARGMVHGGTPSVGSIVYFNITSFGHTAIYLGAGMIATTTGMDFNGTPNAIRPMSGYASYLGWVMP